MIGGFDRDAAGAGAEGEVEVDELLLGKHLAPQLAHGAESEEGFGGEAREDLDREVDGEGNGVGIPGIHGVLDRDFEGETSGETVVTTFVCDGRGILVN